MDGHWLFFGTRIIVLLKYTPSFDCEFQLIKNNKKIHSRCLRQINLLRSVQFILTQKCELCETNNIIFQCINCDELMCETCKTLHLRSKASKKHKTEKCPSHTEEVLLMYCNTCNYPICRECVTSGVHLNHFMVKVEEVIDTKQQQLSNILRQTNEKSER
ncbi:hypothetical protein KUTeg_000869 [Tegillarca granosa]|uniref:B box-type domain-containing protein n=1 Tax=Tegillarca granosa TaxID=220873 RepID=A0ABQ9FWG7_TEGGR|nr:hypothetical protein KUTeg_000869 [Tegillarca granosa]